jgi:hypothetical protein
MIDVRNADRVVIDSAQGTATLMAPDSVQTVSVTGTGGNALVLGSPGSITQSMIAGGSTQTVVAGQPGERGSITIYGTQSGGPFNPHHRPSSRRTDGEHVRCAHHLCGSAPGLR